MKKMMIAVWAGTLMMFVTLGSLLAHHALGGYDTSTAIHVRGTLVVFQMVNPHSRLVVDEKQKDGHTHRWIVDGPGALQLKRMNIGTDTLKPGEILEVCGYATRQGAESQRTIFTEPPDLHLKSPAEVSITGQILDGETLVMPGGKQQSWSDYGFHKCLGPDYADQHTNGVRP